MSLFRYTAVDPDGRARSGYLDASSRPAAVAALERRGALPVTVRDAGAGAWAHELLRGGGPRVRAFGPEDARRFAEELAAMLAAGQQLDQALHYLEEEASGGFAGAIGRIRERVREGVSLSRALELHAGPRLPPEYVGLVRAGEAAGRLGECLGDLADLLRRRAEVRDRLRSALTYPAILAATALLSVLFLLTAVFPQFARLFAQSGAELPALTRLMIGLGETLRAAGPLLLAAMLAAALGARALLRRPGAQTWLARGLLRLPIVGPLIADVETARLLRSLGTLLEGGLRLVPALLLASDTTRNPLFRAALRGAAEAAKRGRSLADGLGEGGVMPRRAIQFLRLGESTGAAARTALAAAAYLEARAQRRTDRLTDLLTPAITLIMGLVVALMVGSLASAMLGINQEALG